MQKKYFQTKILLGGNLFIHYLNNMQILQNLQLK